MQNLTLSLATAKTLTWRRSADGHRRISDTSEPDEHCDYHHLVIADPHEVRWETTYSRAHDDADDGPEFDDIDDQGDVMFTRVEES